MKKKFIIICFTVAVVMTFTGCSAPQNQVQEQTSGQLKDETQSGGAKQGQEESSEMESQDTGSEKGYHKITAEKAKEMMEQMEVTIVDVRTAEEYEEGHVPNAFLVPNEEIGQEPPELLTDQEAILLVYCRSGRRSKDAAEKLVAMGYQQVYDMGGIIDWPYETVKGEQ